MLLNYLYVCVIFGLCFPAAVKSYKILSEFESHPNWRLLDRGDECGHSAADRIIGGVQARLGQYPWIARLGYGLLQCQFDTLFGNTELTFNFELHWTADDIRCHFLGQLHSPQVISESLRCKNGVSLISGATSRQPYNVDPDDTREDTYDCGGTIISDRYILTAAHCKTGTWGSSVTQVRLGEHNAKTDIDCLDGVCAPPVQDIEVEERTCHSDFHETTFQNDICLLRLAAPIQFNKFVAPICLPVYDFFESNQFTGKILEVAGWGVTSMVTRQNSDVLLTLNVPVVDHSSCVQNFGSISKPILILDKQICAGGVIGEDSCGGDSGGPLMSPFAIDAPPRYFVVGVVSFGRSICANSDSPGVYTEVFKFMSWILDHIRE